ncbi:MAG TPA: SAM-dependent methyltransferase [Cytophagales bacterium]|jgi:ubiquinone/menaquinone biosynthesis C-methylase UbiE|nr:SAM-dependent methyltransferase [Cytophagales bacterium]
MSIYTTEITSEQIVSDNPIHQRLLFAYTVTSPLVKGDLLEIGCGEGRGIELLDQHVTSYTAVDKIADVIQKLATKYPKAKFWAMNLPPLKNLPDNFYDTVVSFQVIEHIQKDKEYLKEIARVLKPGGKAYITTPNRPMSLSRNPWHVREYTGHELEAIAKPYFSEVKVDGVFGSKRFLSYHERNRASVNKIMRWDILNLQYLLPAWLLRIPYEFANRFNRNNLLEQNDELVRSISQEDFFIAPYDLEAIDLFLVATK